MDTKTAEGKGATTEAKAQDKPEQESGEESTATAAKTDGAVGTKGDKADAAGEAEKADKADKAETAKDASADKADDSDAQAVSDASDDLVEDDIEDEAASGRTSMVGAGAAAIVSVGIGLVSLTGGWVGTIAGARASLVGQMGTAANASVSDQVQAVYGDSWHATALVGGIFAFVGLLVGFGVLLRAAYWTPRTVGGNTWVKSTAWAGVSLGVIGLLLAVAKYTDLFLGMPSAP